jgi:hypothetical protein
MFARRLSSFVAGALLVAGCVPVAAQTTGSARPFHGALFGPKRADNSTQNLDLSLLAVEAYDDNVSASLGGTVDPNQRQVGGYFSMLQPSVDYRWKGRRTQIGISGASAFNYYPQLRSIKSISHTVGAGLSVQLAKRSALLLNQTAAYSPSYLYGLFPTGGEVAPGDAIPAAPNYSINDVESYTYGTTATFSHGITQRMSASLGGNYRYTDFVHETALQRDATSQGLDAQLSYQRTRNVAIQSRYHYTTGNLGYGGSTATDEHGLEGGVSYSRPLSATRRVTFTFNVGLSMVSTTGATAGVQLPDSLYRASGDADFDYQFALSWRASGTFRRGLEFVPGLAQPVFTNGVTSTVEGLLSRRVEITLSAGYSQGRSAIMAAASQFDTYNGSARLQYALSNSTAIHVEYLYYFYDFLGDALLVPGAPPRMQRNGVRIGLRLLIPALKG